ncbi:uncharacterized protein LOC144650204 isoform X2 [Oculina patagonica]
MDVALPRLRRNLRIIGKQIRKLPSRIRRAVRRGLERVFTRLRLSRDSNRKLERFQSSIEKIFSSKRRGSSRGADESSGFISDEEELDDVPPVYSNTELKIKAVPVNPGSLSAETDGPIEIEMIVFR